MIFQKKPYFAHLIITDRCNLKCKMCVLWRSMPRKEMTTEEIFKVIDVLKKMGVLILSVSGGEPLLREDLFEVIKYAKKRRIYVQLTSNGTLPLEKYRQLIDSRINRIQISLHSLDPEKQEFISQKEGVWNEIMETLKFLSKNKKTGQIINVISTVSAVNLNEIPELIKFCSHKLKIPVLPTPVSIGEENEFLLRSNDRDMIPKRNIYEIDKVYNWILKKRFVYKTFGFGEYFRMCRDNLKTGINKWDCRAGELFFDIMPDGSFGPCQEYSIDLKVFRKDFLDYYKKSVIKARSKEIREKCPGCFYSCYISVQFLLTRPWNFLDLGLATLSSEIRTIFRGMKSTS